MSAEADNDALRVLAVQGNALDRHLAQADATAATADAAIGDAEKLLARLGKPLPDRKDVDRTSLPMRMPLLRTWDEIATEASLMRVYVFYITFNIAYYVTIFVNTYSKLMAFIITRKLIQYSLILLSVCNTACRADDGVNSLSAVFLGCWKKSSSGAKAQHLNKDGADSLAILCFSPGRNLRGFFMGKNGLGNDLDSTWSVINKELVSIEDYVCNYIIEENRIRLSRCEPYSGDWEHVCPFSGMTPDHDDCTKSNN